MSAVGKLAERTDAAAKVRGALRYVGDLKRPGMLHGAILAAPAAPATIKSIDVSAARALPGVIDIVTAAELGDKNSIGIIFGDQPLLADGVTRMVGERIALIAAESPAACAAALAAIELDLDEQPGVYDVAHALADDAPLVHPDSPLDPAEHGNLIRRFRMEHGDLAAARGAAQTTIDASYTIGGQEHGYLEPQGVLAEPHADGGMTLHASCQCPFYVRGSVAELLDLPLAAVRVIQSPTGGGFGGKEDYPSEIAAAAAFLAHRTGRPVSLLLPRELDFQATTKRHAMRIRHRLYADAAGRILGVDIEIHVDAGAYVGLSTVVAERANSSAVGPYVVDAVRVITHVCYTNNLYGGPYRGFGAPQVTVAHEAQIDRLARELGRAPADIRRLNLLSPERPVWSTGETIPGSERLTQVLDAAEAAQAANGPQDAPAVDERFREGSGLGLFIYGCNLHHGGQPLDRSAALVQIQADGSVSVAMGVTDMGQGAATAARSIAARALGAPEDAVRVAEVDTAVVPDSGPTVASRATLVAGRAIIDGAEQLLERLRPLAAELLDVAAADIVVLTDGPRGLGLADGSRRVDFAQVAKALYAARINPGVMGWFRSDERAYDGETGQGEAYMFYSFGAHVARVRVDTWTGRVFVLGIHAVHDVGRIIHRPSIEGQVEGGAVQAMGWACLEELRLVKGVLQNPSFTDYLIPTAVDAPAVTMEFLEDPEPLGPFGARGIGEPSFIPGGAAIVNAVAAALGKPVTELPVTPERVLSLLDNEG